MQCRYIRALLVSAIVAMPMAAWAAAGEPSSSGAGSPTGAPPDRMDRTTPAAPSGSNDAPSYRDSRTRRTAPADGSAVVPMPNSSGYGGSEGGDSETTSKRGEQPPARPKTERP